MRTHSRLVFGGASLKSFAAEQGHSLLLVMFSANADEQFMRAALREARKGWGRTSPNPAVGAVLVHRGKIIGRGYHRHAGAPHAEIECLRGASGTVPGGSILYCTLEPCSTQGQTGPCVDEIIRSGVSRVVVGAIDLNPDHKGRGVVRLRHAGIEVLTGVLADESAALNETFNKWIVTGRPFVIAKCGMSLDGRLTRRSGESRWITQSTARRHAHRLRGLVDAILVGAETVRKDNPRLTQRLGNHIKQPWRVVLTRSENLPRNAHLFSDPFASRTLVYKGKSLGEVLDDLGKRKITSVLLEGGGEILGQALDARLIDRVQIYIGPILTSGKVVAFPGQGAVSAEKAAHLNRVAYTKVGQSVCVTGYPNWGE